MNEEKCKAYNFSEKHIWDISDVLRNVMGLKIDKLQHLHSLVSKEVARIRIELEIPDQAGNYPTGISNHIEDIPVEKFIGVDAFYENYLAQGANYDLSIEVVSEDFEAFIKTLKTLPRITREFYAMMIARGRNRNDRDGYNWEINDDYLRRICSYNDIDGEIRLLSEANLCWFEEPDPPDESWQVPESAKWRIIATNEVKDPAFIYNIVNYAAQINSKINHIIVGLDFTSFGKNQ